jgi:hypothetical protein
VSEVRRRRDDLRWAVQVAEVGFIAAAVTHAVIVKVIRVRALKGACINLRRIHDRKVTMILPCVAIAAAARRSALRVHLVNRSAIAGVSILRSLGTR